MVDAGEDSHGSQFFITLRAQKSLKGKYAAFGQCDAIDVARRIANAEKHAPTTTGKSATKPVDRVRLDRVRITRIQATAPAAPAESAVKPAGSSP